MTEEIDHLMDKITEELKALRQEITQLPDEAKLPQDSPLRYMLTPESERLDRMLARCRRMAKEETVDSEIRNLISEYRRLNEVLSSHTDHHHDIEGAVMEKLTKSIERLQEHFSKLCQLLERQA